MRGQLTPSPLRRAPAKEGLHRCGEEEEEGEGKAIIGSLSPL